MLDPLYSTTKPNRRGGVGIAVQTIDRCLSQILKYVEDVQVEKVSSNPQVDRSAALLYDTNAVKVALIRKGPFWICCCCST